jgi:hypothetical protein
MLIASVVGLPLAVAVAGLAPAGSRAFVFLAGAAAVSALALAAGIAGRRSLLDDTPAKGRAALLAWCGLMLGLTAAVFSLWALIGVLA